LPTGKKRKQTAPESQSATLQRTDDTASAGLCFSFTFVIAIFRASNVFSLYFSSILLSTRPALRSLIVAANAECEADSDASASSSSSSSSSSSASSSLSDAAYDAVADLTDPQRAMYLLVFSTILHQKKAIRALRVAEFESVKHAVDFWTNNKGRFATSFHERNKANLIREYRDLREAEAAAAAATEEEEVESDDEDGDAASRDPKRIPLHRMTGGKFGPPSSGLAFLRGDEDDMAREPASQFGQSACRVSARLSCKLAPIVTLLS
jgi:hypothetical protein